MTDWVIAVEQDERDAAGRVVANDAVVHAYDAGAGEAAHSITRRSYTVRADMPWSGLAPMERCPICVGLVPRH
jgi:hypothetical protein